MISNKCGRCHVYLPILTPIPIKLCSFSGVKLNLSDAFIYWFIALMVVFNKIFIWEVGGDSIRYLSLYHCRKHLFWLNLVGLALAVLEVHTLTYLKAGPRYMSLYLSKLLLDNTYKQLLGAQNYSTL